MQEAGFNETERESLYLVHVLQMELEFHDDRNLLINSPNFSGNGIQEVHWDSSSNNGVGFVVIHKLPA